MYTKIIDISQPVGSTSACFPGDAPFQRQVTLTLQESGVVNLCSMSMSPHVGTHADAPIHIRGDMDVDSGIAAADLPLDAFLGAATVIDLAPYNEGITAEQFVEQINKLHPAGKPQRILFKTCHQIRYHMFEDSYAYLTVDLVQSMHKQGIRLVGIDTPSVDHIKSKSLEAHHALDECGMFWLENLDLTKVEAGEYILVALPLKL